MKSRMGIVVLALSFIQASGSFVGAQSGSKAEYAGTVSDYDGNVYRTVKIGRQIWMAENLRTTRYGDGATAKYLNYGNDPSNAPLYGNLYTWATAMRGASNSNRNPSGVRGIAPEGWHIPSKAEWQELTEFIGGADVAGGKLKETGNAHWQSPNAGASDDYGFSALPAGFHDFGGQFLRQGDRCYFMTSSYPDPFDYDRAGILIRNDSAELKIGGLHPNDAYSIRCVKD